MNRKILAVDQKKIFGSFFNPAIEINDIGQHLRAIGKRLKIMSSLILTIPATSQVIRDYKELSSQYNSHHQGHQDQITHFKNKKYTQAHIVKLSELSLSVTFLGEKIKSTLNERIIHYMDNYPELTKSLLLLLDAVQKLPVKLEKMTADQWENNIQAKLVEIKHIVTSEGLVDREIKRRFGKHYLEAVRIQTENLTLQKWLLKMQGFKEIMNKRKSNKYIKAYETTQFLTHIKSAWMSKVYSVKNQKRKELVRKELRQTIEDHGEIDSQRLLMYLIKQRNKMNKTIENHEKDLYKKMGNIRSVFDDNFICSETVLAFTQQPSFMISKMSTSLVSNAMYGQGGIPDKVESVTENLGGLIIFGLEYFLSYEIGGYFTAIQSLNRVIFSHLETMIKAAEPLDTILIKFFDPIFKKAEKHESLQPLSEYLRETIRFDREGIMSKEGKMKWISGLLMILAISGGPFLPILIAYTAATGISYGAKEWIEMILTSYSVCDESIAERIGAVIQFFAYAAAFNYGYKFGIWAFPEINEMTPRKAESLLGVSSDANEREIKKAFRQHCSRQHPDKHFWAPENEKEKSLEHFYQLRMAMETLTKKKQ